MANCKTYIKMFELSLYGELKEKDENELNLHLETCKTCSEEYNSLKETLELFQNREHVEPDIIFMESFWDNLQPELEKVNNSKSVFDNLKSTFANLFNSQPKWTYQLAGGLAILVMGIFIGRFFFNSNVATENTIVAINNENNSVNVSQVKAERYIDRSKVLLLGLVNMDTESENVEPINFQQQKRISQQLVTEAAVLKKELSAPSQRRLKELVSDLEVILLQIANIESEYDLSWIDLVRSGVDKRGIFLKINIQKMQNTNSQSDVKDERSEIKNKNI
ncbi:MAG: zf-HC2 domain-containing protein [Bacteroidetes bacterium]|nr:zf-HC2 domain-containing protein [Bacteroidota bacterium]MBU1116491.1 zf-HC2 domain-containing protein [Bacteroidota bacterium]MBU1797145.1 zf-HC2 domain-containing protein [Bacteroidota bacterium]